MLPEVAVIGAVLAILAAFAIGRQRGQAETRRTVSKLLAISITDEECPCGLWRMREKRL